MASFRSGDVVGIAEDTLSFVLEASEETHPNEYMGFMRGEPAREYGIDRDGVLVTDVLVIPGTTSNPVSATVKTNMKPNDRDAVGSVHSHPNGVLRPSDADLDTFGAGKVHIIVGAPYGRTDWRAFDSQGDPRSLEVFDVDLHDDEFFDFTQEDIDAELAAEGRTDGWEEPDDQWAEAGNDGGRDGDGADDGDDDGDGGLFGGRR